jgi:energy-converting hydrogenase Eha subunit A
MMMSYWVTGLRTAQMLAEAQVVVAIRMAGLMGLSSLPKGEAQRMVAEKSRAFTRAGVAAGVAAAQGKGPDAVARAALAPVARQTRANAKRLTQRKPG